MSKHKSIGLEPVLIRANLIITDDQAFENWLQSLAKEDSRAYYQDCQELASLIGLQGFPDKPWREDERAPAFEQLYLTIWRLHQMGWPLPVLQSLREGKGPQAGE